MLGYFSDEIGESLLQQYYQDIKLPTDDLVTAVAMLDDSYAFDPDHGIVLRCTPEMMKNPLCQPPVEPPRPVEPEYSPFWTSTTCQELPDYAILSPKNGIVSGLVAQTPGKIWKYMTGHLTKLQSPFTKGYFEKMEYVKVPAFWSNVMNVHSSCMSLPLSARRLSARIGSTLIRASFRQSSTSLSIPLCSILQKGFQMEARVPLPSSTT